jgi:hypothetical protein
MYWKKRNLRYLQFPEPRPGLLDNRTDNLRTLHHPGDTRNTHLRGWCTSYYGNYIGGAGGMGGGGGSRAAGSDTETKTGYVEVTATVSNQATNIHGIIMQAKNPD